MRHHLVLYTIISVIFFSCKKPAGTGGNSSIKGTVMAEDWNSSLTTMRYEYPAVDVDVYIIYGSDVSYGDKIKTNGNGEYEFKYLRKGTYKIYAIGKEKIGTTGDTKDVAVSVDVSVSKNKQAVEADQITIKQ